MNSQPLAPLLLAFLITVFSGQFLYAAEPFRFEDKSETKQLTFLEGANPILTYQYDVIEHDHVPRSDVRRTAGCYVHPLYGLNGEILTDNAPADHYHHRVVFWTWPHVGIHEPDGTITEYDLWTSNTPLKQHLVRWIQKTTTESSASIEVENGWYIGDPIEGKKIMTERVWITAHRVQKVEGVSSRAIDFQFRWQPLDKPITLRGSEGKSYGGFTVRLQPFTGGKGLAERNEINRITVPTGIAEGDLPETPLPWADYTSIFGGQSASGAAIFIPRSHPDFPPTWLTRYHGPLCVGWPGVKGRTFRPGEIFVLRYRIWIHDGAVTVPQIEKAYQEYTQ